LVETSQQPISQTTWLKVSPIAIIDSVDKCELHTFLKHQMKQSSAHFLKWDIKGMKQW